MTHCQGDWNSVGWNMLLAAISNIIIIPLKCNCCLSEAQQSHLLYFHISHLSFMSSHLSYSFLITNIIILKLSHWLDIGKEQWGSTKHQILLDISILWLLTERQNPSWFNVSEMMYPMWAMQKSIFLNGVHISY